MNSEFDIRVELRFTHAAAYPAQLIIGVTEAVEKAVAKVEKEEIGQLQEAFTDIPAVVFDAVRHRADAYNGRTLNLDHASSGSLVLAGAAVDLAIWLLNATLGETIKESYKETGLHKRLKDFLLAGRREKAEKIAKEVRPGRFSRNGSATVSTRVEVQDRSITVIVIVVPGPSLTPLPTPSQFLEQDGNA